MSLSHTTVSEGKLLADVPDIAAYRWLQLSGEAQGILCCFTQLLPDHDVLDRDQANPAGITMLPERSLKTK